MTNPGQKRKEPAVASGASTKPAKIARKASAAPVQDTTKTYRKVIHATALKHLLCDGPDHPLYAHHYEQATTYYSHLKTEAGRVECVLAALARVATELGRDEDALKEASDRLEAYKLARLAKPFADQVKNAGQFVAIVNALVCGVGEKLDEQFEDPDLLHSIRKVVAEAIGVPLDEAEERLSEEEFNAAAEEQGQPPEEGRAKPKKTALMKKVGHAKKCLKFWRNTDEEKERASPEEKEKLSKLFRQPEDLYITYVMSDLASEAEAEGIPFDKISGYVTAHDQWEALTGNLHGEWAKRLQKLLRGDLTMLSKFSGNMDVKGLFGRVKRGGPNNGVSNVSEPNGEAESNEVAANGTKIKNEEQEGHNGTQQGGWQGTLSVRSTPNPEATGANPPPAGRALGSLSAPNPSTAPARKFRPGKRSEQSF